MAMFDALIHDAAIQFGLGDKAAPLVSEAVALVSGPPGGLKGFLDRFQKAGLGTLAASWLGKADAAPIPTPDFERVIGAPALDAIAHRLDIALPVSNAALASVTPRLVGLLTPGRVVPAALPPEVASVIPSATGARRSACGSSGQSAMEGLRGGSRRGDRGRVDLVVRAAAGGRTRHDAGARHGCGPGGPCESSRRQRRRRRLLLPRSRRRLRPLPQRRPKLRRQAPLRPLQRCRRRSRSPTTNGAVQISGAVHDDADARLDPRRAERRLRSRQGAGRLCRSIANRAAAPWLDKLGAALGDLKVPGLSAAFEGAAVKLHGALPEDDLGKIADALKNALGAGTTVEATVDAPPAAAVPTPIAPPPPAAPAQLNVEDVNGAAQISGAVHDEATRGSILDALKGAFGADKVQGDLTLDPSRAAAPWLDKLGAALGDLKVPGLTAAFEGATVKLHGALPEADLGKIADALKDAFGAGTTVETAADALPAAAVPTPIAPTMSAAPAQLNVEDVNGAAKVSGAVHDDQTRSSILDALKAAFGADKIEGDVTVDANRAAAPWLDKLGAALGDLKVPGLQAAFDGARVDLGGGVSDADLNRIADSLKAAIGAGVAVKTPSGSGEEIAQEANDQALQALNALQPGFSGADFVADLNLTIINFATDSAEVPASMRDLLAAAAARFKLLPVGSVVEIAGYTDNTGDSALNVALSQSRADSVRNLLVSDGAPAEMLVAKGYGSADPIASNDTAEGRSRNRRIEYHLKTP